MYLKISLINFISRSLYFSKKFALSDAIFNMFQRFAITLSNYILTTVKYFLCKKNKFSFSVAY